MSNVLAFRLKVRPSRAGNLAALSDAVAVHRRSSGDVFWLKENAEFLNIMAAMGEVATQDVLAPYEAFYDGIEERLRFYPQYYRFFVSMILDLEDLGLAGDKGNWVCDWVDNAGLAEAELSDLQRAEARRLLARRGAGQSSVDDGLTDRLRRFVERGETFAVPNKKAAYELTHIVFYLSEYGRKDPELGQGAIKSLEYAGLVAYLDQNHDLLAEVCTSLRFAGVEPSTIWTGAVADAHNAILPMASDGMGHAADGYHAYMVTGWAQAVAGQTSFHAEVPAGGAIFPHPMMMSSALRPVSERLYDLGDQRSQSWSGMRNCLVPSLSAEHKMVLEQAEESSERFEEFFSTFARAASA